MVDKKVIRLAGFALKRLGIDTPAPPPPPARCCRKCKGRGYVPHLDRGERSNVLTFIDCDHQ